jgi:hypothetical protein
MLYTSKTRSLAVHKEYDHAQPTVVEASGTVGSPLWLARGSWCMYSNMQVELLLERVSNRPTSFLQARSCTNNGISYAADAANVNQGGIGSRSKLKCACHAACVGLILSWFLCSSWATRVWGAVWGLGGGPASAGDGVGCTWWCGVLISS